MKIIKPEITAGPWKLDYDYIESGNRKLICTFDFPQVENFEVNAKAIAALPQAYDALAWVLELLQERNEHPLTQDAVKKALIEAGYKFEDS